MNKDIQLLIFNTLIGNPKGFKLIVKQLGLAKGLSIVLKMQLNMLFNNPFHPMNQKIPPLSWKERLSQKQILPAFALYDALIKKGYSKEKSVATVEAVVIGVANDFLKFTVPTIKESDLLKTNLSERKSMFSTIVDRFPNSFGTLKVDDDESYHFTVNSCLFASYCKKLGYENLATIFCKADRAFFDNNQPLVNFYRSETLAADGSACDFKFNLIAKA